MSVQAARAKTKNVMEKSGGEEGEHSKATLTEAFLIKEEFLDEKGNEIALPDMLIPVDRLKPSGIDAKADPDTGALITDWFVFVQTALASKNADGPIDLESVLKSVQNLGFLRNYTVRGVELYIRSFSQKAPEFKIKWFRLGLVLTQALEMRGVEVEDMQQALIVINQIYHRNWTYYRDAFKEMKKMLRSRRPSERIASLDDVGSAGVNSAEPINTQSVPKKRHLPLHPLKMRML